MSRKEGHSAGEKVSIVRRVMKCEIRIHEASQEAGAGDNAGGACPNSQGMYCQ